MTQAVHAFVHFAWIYSHGQLLFCDMQGTRDRRGKMCLIDPQAHTTEPRTETTVYWDGGEKKIAAWKEQHLGDAGPASMAPTTPEDHSSLCDRNRFCNVLALRTLEMEDLDDFPSPSKSAAKKPTLDFLLH
jgi:hypothetical protein